MKSKTNAESTSDNSRTALKVQDAPGSAEQKLPVELMSPAKFADEPGDGPQKDALSHTPPVIYRLGSYGIVPAEGSWFRNDFFPGGDSHEVSGFAALLDGVLWLSSWKLRDAARFATAGEYEAFLAECPKWPEDQARWAVFDNSRVYDCRNCQPADSGDPEAARAQEALAQTLATLSAWQRQPVAGLRKLRVFGAPPEVRRFGVAGTPGLVETWRTPEGFSSFFEFSSSESAALDLLARKAAEWPNLSFTLSYFQDNAEHQVMAELGGGFSRRRSNRQAQT